VPPRPPAPPLEEPGAAAHRSPAKCAPALPPAFIERLWRTVTYEDIYLRDYQSVPELDQGLTESFRFYNHERPHSALGGKTPAEVHWASLPTLN
jgi:transposase InsO family protein